MALTLGLLLALILAAPFLAEALRRPAHTRRAEAPGRFADLPSGWTHFRWTGPEDGPVAILIHGLTTPSFVWDGLTPLLSATGWRCLSYDLYGRGYSEAAPGRQDSAFFLRQLEDLLDHEGLRAPVTLVGYSMGGAIAAAFAARHPARVAGLVLVAPAGLGHQLRPLELFVQQTPLLGDWLMRLFGGRSLRTGLRALAGSPSTVPGIFERQIRETFARGFLPAVLSSQRHMLGEDRSEDLSTVAQVGLPMAAIWGDADAVIPISAKDRLEALVPGARQEVVAGATHGLPHTHPERVAALLKVGRPG
jgi:pimeloyl-ACP methyl ester carboxylesterase